MGIIGGLLGGGNSDSTSPVVSIIDPPAGGPLAPRGYITFRIMDETALKRALPMTRYWDSTVERWRYEVIHDGDDFTADYEGTRTLVSAGGLMGYEYRVRRRPAWVESPQLVPFAWDGGGNEPP